MRTVTAFPSQRIQVIVEQLELLRQTDRQYKNFGAYQHKYIANPVLTDQAVQDLLPAPDFTLPDDYLEFIQHVGNGGVGPAYGLLSLEQSLKYSRWQSQRSVFRYMTAWQPLFGGHTWTELEKVGELTNDMNTPVPETRRAEYDTWRDDYESFHHLDGTLTISQEGCGHETLLVVSGSERGHIWCDSRVSDAGIVPVNAPNRRFTFLDWYEKWLNDSVEELRGNA